MSRKEKRNRYWRRLNLEKCRAGVLPPPFENVSIHKVDPIDKEYGVIT